MQRRTTSMPLCLLRKISPPILARVSPARNRFTELTAQVYGAHAPRDDLPEPDEFFAEMERAAHVLETKVSNVDRSHPWPRRLMVGALLYPTQFGSYEDMRPLEVADQTLRELIEKAEHKRR